MINSIKELIIAQSTLMYVDYKEEISMEHENLWVCEHCLAAIESREGNQATLKHYVDEDESKCDWCEESGFYELYELI